jgi:hypothetical protein
MLKSYDDMPGFGDEATWGLPIKENDPRSDDTQTELTELHEFHERLADQTWAAEAIENASDEDYAAIVDAVKDEDYAEIGKLFCGLLWDAK